jgi:aerobic carbon-monoxide dehydrogenase large subunit
MTAEIRPGYIGARVNRFEDARLLVGDGTFVDNRLVPGLLHVALKRSDQPHARIKTIDTSAAAAMPGVVGVFTAGDLDGMITPIRATSRMKGYQSTPLHALAIDKLRYVGEPVVAVVAENRYLAEDAVGKIIIEAEPLPALVDPEQSAADGAPLLHEEMDSNILAVREFTKGDVDGVMAGAAITVGGRFRFHRKSPVAMENRAYQAEYSRAERSLTLHSTTQVPGIIRDALVQVLGMKGNKLRVVAPDVGGGFGGKTSLYPEEFLVCALARHLRMPVKWAGDRVEDLMSTSQAFDEIIDAELALDSDGNILALSADVTGDSGAYSIYPWTAVIEPVQVVSFLPGPYRLENYHARVRAVATNKVTSGPYRGVGRPISTFVMERLMDMAAKRLGIDPVALRLQNFVGDDEFPYKTGSGIVWDQSAFTDCLIQARNAIGYDNLRREQEQARAAGRWMGIGVASYCELTGIGSRISAAPGMPINTGTETAHVQIDSSGAVTARFGVVSFGQGLQTTLAQVVADELGVAIGDIEIVIGDSAGLAHVTGSYASRSAVLAGGAATLACRTVREKILKVASHLFEASEDDIDVRDGMVTVTGTDRSMTVADVARALYSEMGRLPKELRDEIDNLEATRVYDPFFGTATSASHMAVVEIDPETFQTTVRRYVVAEDCGRIINPMIADGQAHGGVVQGIGVALLEEIIHDDNGQILTTTLADYVLPGAGEIPHMEIIHLETESESTVGGYRGLGEGGTIGAPAAIANAIADALSPLDIHINELPATPERLFRLVQAARKAIK